MKTWVPVLTALSVAACGGGGGQTNTAADVNCPPGQTFDGEYCKVDQSVATVEEPIAETPAEKKDDGAQHGAQATEQSEEAGAPKGEEPVANAPEEDQPGPESPEQPEGEGPVEEPSDEAEPTTPTQPAHATPVDYAMAAQAAPLMHYVASSHLPSGARPLGAPFAGQFAEGQILEQKVQLQAGKCYTIVGIGLPPVTELNVSLVKDGQEEPLAKDDTNGPQAVLGSRNACYKAPKSGSVKLVLTVEKGQGIAAAQMFQK